MSAKPTDWRKRFAKAKAPHIVMLATDFAGVKAGSTMLISSPEQIARYISSIPRGEQRSVARLRSDLAKRSKVDAVCPVTTAIYLRVVAETALRDLQDKRDLDEVVPFWRVIAPGDKVAAKLSCGIDGLKHYMALDLSSELLDQKVSDT